MTNLEKLTRIEKILTEKDLNEYIKVLDNINVTK
jgi:hypothetical protein